MEIRRYLQCFILLASAALCHLPVVAQEDLSVRHLFDACFKSNASATIVYMKGREIRKYGLTMFRSITLRGTSPDVKIVEEAVKQDAAKALSKEMAIKGGRLYYGFYAFRPVKKDVNRYLFYRNNALGDTDNTSMTLIYMEGEADMAQLRKTFEKNRSDTEASSASR